MLYSTSNALPDNQFFVSSLHRAHMFLKREKTKSIFDIWTNEYGECSILNATCWGERSFTINYSDYECPRLVARNESGLHGRTEENIVKRVWRRVQDLPITIWTKLNLLQLNLLHCKFYQISFIYTLPTLVILCPGNLTFQELKPLNYSQLNISNLKAETERTRFDNATRIFDFQRPLTSILFYFSPLFGRTLAI